MSDIEQLATLSKKEIRYLSNKQCAFCEHRLDQAGCSAIYSPCDEQTRINRRLECLKKYKPRVKA